MVTPTEKTTYNEEVGLFELDSGMYRVSAGITTFGIEKNNAKRGVAFKTIVELSEKVIYAGIQVEMGVNIVVPKTIKNGYVFYAATDKGECGILKYSDFSIVGSAVMSTTPETFKSGSETQVEIYGRDNGVIKIIGSPFGVLNWDTAVYDGDLISGGTQDSVVDDGTLLTNDGYCALGCDNVAYFFEVLDSSDETVSGIHFSDSDFLPLATPNEVLQKLGYRTGNILEEFTSDSFPSIWDVLAAIREGTIELGADLHTTFGIELIQDEYYDVYGNMTTVLPEKYIGTQIETNAYPEEGFIQLNNEFIQGIQVWIVDNDGNISSELEENSGFVINRRYGRLYLLSVTDLIIGVNRIKVTYTHGKTVNRTSREKLAGLIMIQYNLEFKKLRVSNYNPEQIDAWNKRLDLLEKQLTRMMEKLEGEYAFGMT